jgi:ASC-1-like (ASCH) protein
MSQSNNPTPFELIQSRIEVLYQQAKDYLDGEPISSQGMADDVGRLLNLIRAAEKEADELRTAEKRPLDEQVKAIQDRYNPLIADSKSIKGKTVLAAEACKAALAPWLRKIEEQQREAARIAREKAEEAARIAQEALRASSADNLAEREVAEALVKDAKKADIQARVADKQTAKLAGEGTTIALTTKWHAELKDPVAALKHFWAFSYADFKQLMDRLAAEQVRSGVRSIPGYEITSEKVAR